MREANPFLRSVLRRLCSLRSLAVITLMAVAMSGMVQAQLNGSYTVGGSSPSYATIDAALSALSTQGVSGPVTFLIRSGTYAPPAAGYVLNTYTGMSATNTVTIKPDAGATVTIAGGTTTGTAIFDLNGAKYYVFDGSNATNGTTKDMTIRQTETTYNPTFWLRNDADLNVIKNCNVQGNGGSVTKTSSANGIGIVFIGVTTATTGNDSNVVRNCTIGDPTGTFRNNVGVGIYGTSSKPNSGNKILSCDIINFGSAGTYGYGVDAYAEQAGTVVDGCDIHMTVSAPSSVTTLYGIYTDYSPGYPINSVFNGNRVYKLTSLATNWTIYGMYHWVSTSTANSTISNNMFSFAETGDHTIYGIYFQSSTGSTNLYHNSFYFGGSATGSRSTYMLYKSSSNTINNKNNIYYSVRSGGSAPHYGYYISSTSTWVSNNNLFVIPNASNYYAGYWSGAAKQTIIDFRTSSGQEAGTVIGNPRYIDPANGNLHIQTGVATMVESKGANVGVTTDYDGNARVAATPDIGADEGAFTSPLANDMSSDRVVTPAIGSIVQGSIAFTPTATFINAGGTTQNNVSVRMRIIDATTNAVVYTDVKTIPTITGGDIQMVTFGQNGSGGGTTALAAGNYNVEITTQLAGDQDVTNDTYTGAITVKTPLSGTYTINKLGAGARNYTSFTAAVADLTALGVLGPVVFEVATGTYDATTETFPLRLPAALNMSAVNTVTFRPATGATVMISASTPASSAIFLIEGGRYYTIDGSNTVGGTSKNMTIRQLETTYNPAIWLRNDADLNVIKNCNVQASGASMSTSSSSSGIGAIYIGVTTATTATPGNDSNLVQNCTIGDPAGTYRSNVGFGCYGTSSKPNSGNKITGCDIINFGNGSTAYGVVAYAEQAGTVVENCDIHMTVAAPSGSSTMYGIYTDYSPGYPINSVFNGNRIYKLMSAATNWSVYGIYHWVSTASANSTITNNMISLGENGDHTIYGIYFSSSTGSTNFFYNSILIQGTATGTRNTYALYKSSANAIVANNNIFASTRTGGTGSNYGTYVSSTTTWTSNRNLFSIANAATSYVAYYSGAKSTLAAYTSAANQDINSVAGSVTFVDAINGNLHIDPVQVFSGESRGTPLAVVRDFDNQVRDAVAPDLGADEGDFNGGGIRVVTPNGGEKYSVDYSLDVTYTLTRALPVRIDFSTNGGATWTTKGTFNGVTGTNVSTITTPSNITSQARVRVMSQKNVYEGDSSDANFELVLPVFTMVLPNGGEKLVPTDTVRLQWNAQFTPPAMRLQLDYSTNNGSTWTAIDTNVYAVNMPATNYYNWIVPNAPTSQALVRVKVAGSPINDLSDAPFTITDKPNVTMLSPTGGQSMFVGDTSVIRWTTVNTQYVKLTYSVDGGASWIDIVPNGEAVPAYVGSFAWKVPNTPTTNGIVRITNVERPRFFASTTPVVSILNSTVQVMQPNGGERYDMSQPVTVNWSALNASNLRLDYSSDNGTTWTAIANVNGALGTYTFTPVAIPTKLGRVRLVNIDRQQVQDMSDAPFEIMEAKSVVVYTPAEGDKFVKGTSTVITWDAPRMTSVSISYSPTGSAPWQTVATNVLASLGSFTWNVPTQLTTQGKIRIQETGGVTFGESGSFSIVEQAQPSLRVLVPNGGEIYTAGDTVKVRWTATAVNTVSIYFSEDGTTNWQRIGQNLPAGAGQMSWVTTGVNPGTTYRVRVEAGSNSSIFDVSDGPFTIMRKLQPSITVLYPNDAENLTIGTVARIRWTAQDLAGANVKIELSRDNGDHWDSIATAPATPGQYDWTVTDPETKMALVRVSTPGAGDVSNAVFEISRKVVEPIVVLTPNGNEQWHMRSKEMITWDAPASVANVDIYYSIDGGSKWDPVMMTVPSTGAGSSYQWSIPDLTSPSQSALVKIVNSTDASQSDISNGVFSVLNPIAGVESPVAGTSSLRSLGNFPNPFAGWTELRWQQGTPGDVEISIYQQSGVLVNRYAAGRREAGEQRFVVSGSELASGAYIYEIRAGREVARGVMMLVR